MYVEVNGFGLLAGWRRRGKLIGTTRRFFGPSVIVVEFVVPKHQPIRYRFRLSDGVDVNACMIEGPDGTVETGWRICEHHLRAIHETSGRA